MTIEQIKEQRILVVDLDKTLVKTDLLDEALIRFLKKNPIGIFGLLKVLFTGKHHFKGFLAEQSKIHAEALPYNAKVLAKIAEAKANGETVVLASASHELYVREVADHLKVFDAWYSTKDVNFKSLEKVATLRKAYPGAKFRYMGDSSADIPIWKEFGQAHTVNPSRMTQMRLKRNNISVEKIDSTRGLTFHTLRKAMRVHQWAKNMLIFAPLFLAHNFESKAWIDALVAFLAFSLTASSIYLINDLLDIDADRKHPTKRFRPFASGSMSIREGLLVLAAVASLAITATAVLSPGFMLCIAIYFVANLAYSFRFKQVQSLDVLLLASMYTIRIIAGGQATGIAVTQWLLSFSTFIFFGLAMVKRFVEVGHLKAKQSAAGRGYIADDSQMLGMLGVGSTLLSCLVLALYFNSDAVLQLYQRPQYLWFILPLQLYWTSHLWIMAGRGKVDSDPVLYTLKDKNSHLIAFLVLLILWLAH